MNGTVKAAKRSQPSGKAQRRRQAASPKSDKTKGPGTLTRTVQLALDKPHSLSQAQVLQMQQTLGNRQVGRFLGSVPAGTVQRNGTAEIDIIGGNLLKGQKIKKISDGELPERDKYDYQPSPEDGPEYYIRKVIQVRSARRDPAELEAARRAKERQDLQRAQSDLFGVAEGGDQEGTFEYVANYLYSEVYKVSAQQAQGFWDEAYRVVDGLDGNPVRFRNVIADQKGFLQRMINIGLDASWKKKPVQELIQEKVGDKAPAAAMPTVQPAWWPDYLLDIYHWRPWSKLMGIGFHTTDGVPGAVMKRQEEGGWGGISRPMTAQFFQNRYALAQPWNPLKGWLDAKGPTFRKGIKDNELLSTVSVATELHKSVKFPLANKNRRGENNIPKNGANTFKMKAYVYVVMVKEGFATFANQPNPFPEIATGDIPIGDIIGYAEMTRWHDYMGATDNPDSDSFWYEVGDFIVNPAGPKDQRFIKLAQAEIAKEKAKSAGKYTPAG